MAAALWIFDRALAKFKTLEVQPGLSRVFLYSGCMIDASDRKKPRFPPEKESATAEAIPAELNAMDAEADDLAFAVSIVERRPFSSNWTAPGPWSWTPLFRLFNLYNRTDENMRLICDYVARNVQKLV